MKTIALVGAIIIGLSIPASAETLKDINGRVAQPNATSDPMLLLYRMSGVKDDGTAEEVGLATTFFCTNWNTIEESIRIKVYSNPGAVVADTTRNLSAKQTMTISTHGTKFGEALPFLAPGVAIGQGSAAIAGTSKSISCTAMMVDAATVQNGIDLHLVRFNADTGSTE